MDGRPTDGAHGPVGRRANATANLLKINRTWACWRKNYRHAGKYGEWYFFMTTQGPRRNTGRLALPKRPYSGAKRALRPSRMTRLAGL